MKAFQRRIEVSKWIKNGLLQNKIYEFDRIVLYAMDSRFEANFLRQLHIFSTMEEVNSTLS